MNRRLLWVLKRGINAGIAKGYSFLIHATQTGRSIVPGQSARKRARGPVSADGYGNLITETTSPGHQMLRGCRSGERTIPDTGKRRKLRYKIP
jgi:hypothetical protein